MQRYKHMQMDKQTESKHEDEQAWEQIDRFKFMEAVSFQTYKQTSKQIDAVKDMHK